MTTRGSAPQIKSRVKVTYAGTTYTLYCTNKVRRIRMQDSPPHVPTSGIQSVLTRPYHAVVSVKDIKSDFAHQVELRFTEHGGVINHLASSTLDTRWGPLWLAPAENNPTNPTDANVSWWIGPNGVDATTFHSNITTANMNPKAGVYFQGTIKSGLYLWRVKAADQSNKDVELLNWGGTSYAVEATISATNATEDCNVFDLIVHKAALCALVSLGTASRTRIWTSTDGDTISETAGAISATVAIKEGSRLFSDGNTLYAFSQNLTTTGGFDILSSTTLGGAWTSRIASVSGQLRDVSEFFDLTETRRPMVLTEGALFYWDTTNYIVETVIPVLPAAGRAIIPFKGKLLVAMDSQRVYEYSANGAFEDISPGGTQGMPSGFDFGPDTSGQVCVCQTPRGIKFLWSGKDMAGAVQKPLCLEYSGRDANGDPMWHFIWQKADTSISSAARFVAFDPTSGDLLMGIQDATAEDTTLVQLKDIDVSPENQSTLDRKTSGAGTLPRLDFGSPIVSTTIWDCFLHTNGLDANETIAVAYRTDGSTGAYTTVATVAADNTRITFPANAATDAGLNFRDVQLQFTFAANAVTDVIKAVSFDVGYNRIWPVRGIYILDALFEEGLPADAVPPEVMEANIETLQAATVKMQLLYGNLETAKMVFPIPSGEEITEILQAENLPSTPRTGTARLVLLEA